MHGDGLHLNWEIMTVGRNKAGTIARSQTTITTQAGHQMVESLATSRRWSGKTQKSSDVVSLEPLRDLRLEDESGLDSPSTLYAGIMNQATSLARIHNRLDVFLE